jgi:cytochrome c556
MKIKVIAAALTLVAGAALAQGDPVQQRKDAMKAVGAATGPVGRMLQGAEPFDLAKAQNALTVYINTSKTAPALWPAGSDKGETRTLPAVFAEKDKFNGIFAKWGADATAAQAAIKDEASFKTEMPKVLANCGACHTPYRRPQ